MVVQSRTRSRAKGEQMGPRESSEAKIKLLKVNVELGNKSKA